MPVGMPIAEQRGGAHAAPSRREQCRGSAGSIAGKRRQRVHQLRQPCQRVGRARRRRSRRGTAPYRASISSRSHAALTSCASSPPPTCVPANTCASAEPGVGQHADASASRSGCVLTQTPGAGEPKPAQVSRVRTRWRLAALGLGRAGQDEQPPPVPVPRPRRRSRRCARCPRRAAARACGVSAQRGTPSDALRGEPAVGGRAHERLPGRLLLDAESAEDVDERRGPRRAAGRQDELAQHGEQQGARAARARGMAAGQPGRRRRVPAGLDHRRGLSRDEASCWQSATNA